MQTGTDVRRLLAVTLVVALSGCAALVAKRDRKHPPPPALVTTGGPFAIEQTVAIPSTGLTLGGVVDGALRSGWSAQRTTGLTFAPSPSKRRSAPPVSEQGLTPNEHFNNAIVEVEDAPTRATVLLSSQKLLGNLFPEAIAGPELLQQVVADLDAVTQMPSLQDVDSRQAALEEHQESLESMGASAAEELKRVDVELRLLEAERNAVKAERIRIKQLTKAALLRHISEDTLSPLAATDRPSDEALQTVATRAARLQVASSDRQGQQQIAADLSARLTDARERGLLNQPTEDARRAVLYRIAFSAPSLTTATDQPTLAGEIAEPATSVVSETAPPMNADELVVVLTRRTGRSLVFPLDLVQRSSAGDVWLGHGDRVTITSFRRTDLAQAPSDNELEAIALTSLTTEPVAQNAAHARFVGFSQLLGSAADASKYADIVIIRRVNARGGVDEYYLPIVSSPLDPGYAFAETCLTEAMVQGGDHVHFDMLENTSIVRESRDKARRVATQRFAPEQKVSLLEQWDLLDLVGSQRARKTDLARGLNQQLGQDVFADPSAHRFPQRPPFP